MTLIFPSPKIFKAMKTLAILSFSLLMFVSCKDDGPGDVEIDLGVMTAVLDGTPWEAKNSAGGVIFTETQGSVSVQGTADDDSQIVFLIPNPVQGVEYTFTDGLSFQYSPTINTPNPFALVDPNGGVKFTELSNTRAVGTFSGTLTRFNPDGSQESIVLTQGRFEVDR